MVEYGLLSGSGGTMFAGLFSALDSLIYEGRDLIEPALDHPVITFGVLMALLGWALIRRQR
jgi:hypothetical protein